MLSFFDFLLCCIMVGFLHFLWSGQSGTRSKMRNLVVAFFYWRTNSGFFLSLCNCVFQIHFIFFYNQGSLVKGQVSERQGNSASPWYSLFLSCFLYYLRVFFTQVRLVNGSLEVPYYLDYSSFLYLYESGTRTSLIYSSLVSKVSYYHDFSSILYLHRSGTRLLQGVALSQVSFRFLLSRIWHTGIS